MSRPELQCPPEMFYNEQESAKYNSSSRIIGVQAEISRRALELLALPSDKPAMICDIGCGSGLSGEVLEEAGHVWIGCDISKDMLNIAADKESETGDIFERDMGQGLPFRPATFDGAISVSAIQWLCYANSKAQSAKSRLMRFFNSLHACLKRTGRAALQFYPQNPDQAVLIASCAMRAGFTGGLVVDYPNSTKAKKYYLCLSFEKSYRAPTPLGVGAPGGGKSGSGSSSSGGSGGRRGEVLVIENQPQQQQHFHPGKGGSGGGRGGGGGGSGGRRGGGRGRRENIKGRAWVMTKKERQRAKGEKVRPDTKYTGRKRKDKF